MTTSSGAVVWKAKYSSFGKATVDPSSTVDNPLRFPGQYEDAETGLHYNWFRYYQPIIGRYLRSDPVGFLGGVNFFTFVQNNPGRFYDPFGLCDLAAAIRTTIQILDIIPIPSPYYQIPMEIGAIISGWGDIRNATNVSEGRRFVATLVSFVGVLGALQALPDPTSIVAGTLIDLSAFVFNSYLLGDAYPGAPLVNYIKCKRDEDRKREKRKAKGPQKVCAQ
jgi:RHS repeat-associated protein